MLYLVWTYCLIFHNICPLDRYYYSIHTVCLNLEDKWSTCYTLSELIAWFFIISVFWTDIIFHCRDSVFTTKRSKKWCDYVYRLTIFFVGSDTLIAWTVWLRINATYVLLYVVVSNYLSFRWKLYLITETLSCVVSQIIYTFWQMLYDNLSLFISHTRSIR